MKRRKKSKKENYFKFLFKVTCIIFILLFISSFLFYHLWFLRKPGRITPSGNVLVSPANGEIIEIIEIKDGEIADFHKGLFGQVKILTDDTISDGYVIVIVMNPLDVHYQRAPLDGTILSTKHTKGQFLNAMSNGLIATLKNERNEILIDTEIGKIKVIQIAGYLVRRIEDFVDDDQYVKKGSMIGLVKLGSQVAVVIPQMELDIKLGDKVIDGETILAHY